MKPVKLLIVSLLLSLYTLSFAQTSRFEIGVDAGPSARVLWPTNNYLGFMAAEGVSANVCFQYNIDHIFSIKTGIGYELEGARAGIFSVLVSPVPFPGYGQVNLNYLTLPVLGKASFGKKVKFFIDAGPYLSVLIEADDRYIEPGINPTIVNLYKHGDLKPYDSGIQAGVGIIIPIKRQFEFSFEDRNSIGLLNLNHQAQTSEEIKTFSSSFLLSFNYKFGKKQTPVKRAS